MEQLFAEQSYCQRHHSVMDLVLWAVGSIQLRKSSMHTQRPPSLDYEQKYRAKTLMRTILAISVDCHRWPHHPESFAPYRKFRSAHGQNSALSLRGCTASLECASPLHVILS